jgi:hypothetical protein
MTTTSPGWYDDGHGAIRWWDGTAWTEHVAPRPADHPVPSPTAATAPPPAEASIPMEPVPSSLKTGEPAAPPDPPHSVPIQPAEPRRSVVWVVWVGLGVILIGVVVAIALLTPVVLAGFAVPSAPPPTPSSIPSSDESADDTLSAADRQAAIEIVRRHNEAWFTGDCEVYFAMTTEYFRTVTMDTADCDQFAAESQFIAGRILEDDITVDDVLTVDAAVGVLTTGSYMTAYDKEGSPSEGPGDHPGGYVFILVRSNGGWVIDDGFAG